eukprot:gene7419-8679_t
MTSNSIDLKDSKGKLLQDTVLVAKAFKNLDDGFILKNANQPIVDVVAAVAPTKPTTTATAKKSATPAVAPKKSEVQGCDPRFKQVIEGLLERGDQLYEKQSYKNAAEHYENILQLYPTEFNSLYKLGSIYQQAKKYEKAEKYITLALKHRPQKDYTIDLLSAELKLSQKEYKEASKHLKSAMRIMGPKDPLYGTTNAKYGRALYDTRIPKRQQKGCEILNNIVHSDESNLQGLVGFAYVLRDRKQDNDALTVLMQLLSRVGSSDKKEYTKETIADIVKDRGVDMLLAQLKDTAASAHILSFLSSMVKDYGAVDESVAILQKAYKLDPMSANTALNLVHGLEVCNRYDEAIRVLLGFLKFNRPRGLTNYKLTCGSLLQQLGDIDPENPFESASHRRPMPETGRTPAPTDLLTSIPADEGPKPAAYTKDDHDFLALWYTLVKVLYVAGILEPLPKLVRILEPTRRERNLHLTTVRNEHAYFCCISQLMTHKQLPVPNDRPIYIAGDSHAMTTSWTSATIGGEARLFHPLLTTGLKMWHLRPSSKFFPKNNFYNVTCTAPKGSEIVFMFGEIDCREGILVSVEKCRYTSIEEGMEVTIDIYINALKDLIAKYQYKAYVHPVVPVLNETRFLVKQFNKILKQKVDATPELLYLDFFEKLLDTDGGFNTQYALDGTHMNPSYVKLLEAAINEHVTQK